jgi:hypothetical protein
MVKEKRFEIDFYHLIKKITEPSIFVAISSYRDPELCVTLIDLMDKAYNPDRVYIGVVEQNDPLDVYSAHAKNSGLHPLQ